MHLKFLRDDHMCVSKNECKTCKDGYGVGSTWNPAPCESCTCIGKAITILSKLHQNFSL